MKANTRNIFLISFLLIAGLYFSINGLIQAKAFLAPVVVAGLLSMMFIPMTNKLEKSGIGRGWAAFIAVLTALLFAMGIFFLISMQVERISQDWPEIKKQLKPNLEQLQEWVAEKSGIEPAEQKNILQEQIPGEQAGDEGDSKNNNGNVSEESPESSESNGAAQEQGSQAPLGATVGSMLLGFLNFLATALLTCVYIFFMLLYRSKLHKSLLRFFSDDKKPQAKQVLQNSVKVSQDYLIGRFWLITILAVMYSIGLSISGVQHAVLISILGALLSLVPYIGNVVAFGLATAMGAFSGLSLLGYVGIIATFSITQFVESYMLEPYIVGHKVELNPLITILVVVLGGAVWGIVGMIVVIPLFGILKIVCDNVPMLNPVGYLLGEEGVSSSDQESSIQRYAKKIRDKFTEK